MNTNILAPFVKSEESFKFYVNGRVFEMNDNTITETESFDSTLGNAIKAFESFEFSATNVKWFHGASKFTYSLTENEFTTLLLTYLKSKKKYMFLDLTQQIKLQSSLKLLTQMQQ